MAALLCSACKKIMEDGTVLNYGEYYTPTSLTIDGLEYSCMKSSSIYNINPDDWDEEADSFDFDFKRILKNKNNEEISLNFGFSIERPLIRNTRYDLKERISGHIGVWDQDTHYGFPLIDGWVEFKDINFQKQKGVQEFEYCAPTIRLAFEFSFFNGTDTSFVKNGYTQSTFERYIYSETYYETHGTTQHEFIIDGEYFDFWPE